MFNFARLCWAFARRDFANLVSYRLQLLLGVASLLFYLLIFFFVSAAFSGMGARYLARYGGAYFPFVVVGLAFQGLVAAGLGGFSQVISSEQYLGTLEPMLGRRISAFRVLAAASVSRYFFSAGRLVALLAAAVAIFGMPFRAEGLPAFLGALVLTVAVYFGLGMLSAGFVLAFKQGNPVNLFFGQLGIILSGVFFPVEVLPRWLRAVGAAIPLTYGLDIARDALLAGSAPAPRSWWALAIFAAGALAAGGLTFRWALGRAKRDGSLSQY